MNNDAKKQFDLLRACESWGRLGLVAGCVLGVREGVESATSSRKLLRYRGRVRGLA